MNDFKSSLLLRIDSLDEVLDFLREMLVQRAELDVSSADEVVLFEHLDALEDLGEVIFEPVERAVEMVEVERDQFYGKERPVAPAIIVTYLNLCKSLGKTPDPSLDEVFNKFARSYASAYSDDRSGCAPWLPAVRDALAALPPARLHAMMRARRNISWLLVASLPTEKVGGTIFEYIKNGMTTVYKGGSPVVTLAVTAHGPAVVAELDRGFSRTSAVGRQVIAHALGEAGWPEGAPVLVRALHDAEQSVREQVREALAKLDPEAALDVLPQALTASRPETRLAAAKTLAEMKPTPRGHALARERIDAEADEAVREALASVLDPEQMGRWDDEAVRHSLATGYDWRELSDVDGPTLVRCFLKGRRGSAFRRAEQQAELDELIRSSAQPSRVLAEAVAAAAPGLHSDSPLMEHLHASFDDAAELLAEQVREDRFDAGTAMHALEWLADHAPRSARAAFLDALGHSRKTVRAEGVRGLVAIGESTAPDVWELLASGDLNAGGRQSAAEVLTELTVADAVPHLEEALDSERSKKARAAIEEALAACQKAAVSVDRFADDAAGHRKLDDALAGLDFERPADAPADLPELRWRSGEPVSAGAIDWLLHEVFAEDLDTRSQMAVEVRERLDPTSAHALCDALIEDAPQEFAGRGIYVRAPLGGQQHIDAVAAELPSLASSASTAWGDHGVAVLERHGSKEAVQWLDHFRRKSRKKALRRRAGAALERAAERRGVSVDRLVELTLPDFGFDASGQQVLDYGPRQVIARLDAENGVVFVDEKGKVRKSLPRARKSDDADKVAEVKDRFKGLKKRLKKVTASLTSRFEDALASGRTWSPGEWRERFVEHPIAFAFTTGLVFEQLDDGAARFAVAAEGTPIDVDGEAFELDSEAPIRLGHPVDFDEDVLAAWREHMAMREAAQPVAQLDREVFRPESDSQSSREWVDDLPAISSHTFRGRLQSFGYEEGRPQDAGYINEANRRLDGWSIVMRHSGYSASGVEDDVELYDVDVLRDAKPVAPADLSARLRSEVLRDATLLTRGK